VFPFEVLLMSVKSCTVILPRFIQFSIDSAFVRLVDTAILLCELSKLCRMFEPFDSK